MTEWMDRFPGLAMLDATVRKRLQSAARLATLPAGAVAFRGGSECESYLFVLSGSVRVQMVSATGREIVLYRVEAGQTCILTTACLMASEDYPADAVAETEVRAAVLPAADFQAMTNDSPAFRSFVFEAYGRRIADLMALVDAVAFGRVDVRLAGLLLERGDADGLVALTHQELAIELGSVREVVSRQLKEFERRGHVRLQRARIAVRDVAALRALAGDRTA